MEELKLLEKALFSIEFNNNPHIRPFSITLDDITWHYKTQQHNDKWYIVTNDN